MLILSFFISAYTQIDIFPHAKHTKAPLSCSCLVETPSQPFYVLTTNVSTRQKSPELSGRVRGSGATRRRPNLFPPAPKISERDQSGSASIIVIQMNFRRKCIPRGRDQRVFAVGGRTKMKKTASIQKFSASSEKKNHLTLLKEVSELTEGEEDVV